jgi:hypothetical protein
MAKGSDSDKTSQSGQWARRGWVRGRGLSPYSFLIRFCKECGVPMTVAKDHIWEEHGRILSCDTSQRLIIVERKILEGIFNRISERIGESFKKSLLSAKAFDASQYTHSVMVGWKKVISGYPVIKKPFYELMCDHVRLLGMADARLARYKRGKEVVISCTQCYNRTMFGGDVLGGVYALEGKDVKLGIEERDGEIFFKANMLEGGDGDTIQEYPFSWEVPLPGYISYKRCRNCDTPFPVSFFSWDISKGLMVDTFNGEPVTLVDIAGINAVHEAIKKEQGGWVDDFLAQVTKEEVDTILPELEWKRRRPEEKVRDLFFLAYRGMGNPVFAEPTEEGIRARVENPFNYPMVAGITASFLARGKPVTFTWERTMPGRLEVNLSFQ